MDPTSILFVSLMVILTGGMAYAGDVLGRYLGKKRITLGKMRPKHTAALITAMAGSFGALLVVLILMGVSEPVRVWILSGNQAREELISAQKDLTALKGQTKDLEGKLSGAQQKLTNATTLASKAEDRNKKLSQDFTSLSSNSERLQAEIANQTKQVQTLTKTSAQERQKLGEVRKELDKEKGDAARIRADNTSIQTRNLELTQANATLETQKASLEKTRKDLETRTGELSASIETLRNTFDSTSREQRALLQASQEQLQASTEELGRITTLLASTQADINRLESERLQLLGLSEASRTQPMVVERLDELARLPLPAGLSQAEAKRLLTAAVERASTAALNRGSGVSPSAKSAAVFVNIGRSGATPVTPDMQQEALVREMAGAMNPRVLILRALVNTFAGEPVPLDAAILPNPIIYSQGQVVAETRLDGRDEQDVIAQELTEFIQADVVKKVMRDGLIPAKGSVNPLGEMSRDTVLRLVQAVRESRVSVKVQFVALEATRAGDPLRLDYRIR